MHFSRMHTARSSSRRGGGVCLSACWDTPPLVWAWRHTPLGVGLETPTLPPGCGPGDPHPSPWLWACRPLGLGLETPQVWAWRPPRPDPETSLLGAGIPPPLETCCKACWDTTCNACWDTTPPVNRITDKCKNMTLLQLRCGR